MLKKLKTKWRRAGSEHACGKAFVFFYFTRRWVQIEKRKAEDVKMALVTLTGPKNETVQGCKMLRTVGSYHGNTWEAITYMASKAYFEYVAVGCNGSGPTHMHAFLLVSNARKLDPMLFNGTGSHGKRSCVLRFTAGKSQSVLLSTATPQKLRRTKTPLLEVIF